MTTSNSLCWRLVPIVVSHSHNIPEGKDISVGRHGTAVDGPFVYCLVYREGSCSVKCAVIPNMARTLYYRGKYTMIMDKVSEVEAAIYGQLRREGFLEAGQIVPHLSLS